MSREASTILVGKIIGPHGIRGEVKLKSHLVGNLELREGVDIVLLFPDGSRRNKRILKARETAKGPLLSIEGVTDRNSAEELRGVDVEVDSSLLPETSDDEYYLHDLIGLEVHDSEKIVGHIERLIERAGQDLLVVDMGGREALVPFVEPIVVEVDIEAGRVVIDPPEGLLELEA